MRYVFQEAVEALRRYHEENPVVYSRSGVPVGPREWREPSAALSIVGYHYVYLMDSRGKVARYDIKSGEIRLKGYHVSAGA